MNFNPFFIEDVLTISKEKLEELKSFNLCITESAKYPLENTSTFFQVRADSVSSRGNLHLKLRFENVPSYHRFGANVTFYVKSANHSVKYPEVYSKRYDAARCQEWSADLCTLADALNPKKNFLVDGKLIIRMKAMVFKTPYPDDLEKTCSRLGKNLWNRNDDRDFVIVVGAKDGPKTEVKIHKIVLASSSPVFNRMLETEMKEKAQNRLEIIDFNVEVVQAAVEYFYDRDTFKSLNAENLVGLLFFADKYDINDLKVELERHFLFHLYPDTIVKIANASIMSNSAELKKNCIKSLNLYIKNNVQFDDAETLDKEIKNELVYDSMRQVSFCVKIY